MDAPTYKSQQFPSDDYAAPEKIAALFCQLLAREPMLHVSVAAWVLAFIGFAIVYGPVLMRPRA